VGVRFGVVGAASRCGPGEHARVGLDQLPQLMLLQEMVEPAQAAEVASARAAALVVRDAMVEVAAPHRLPAGGETAGAVAGGDVLAQERRGLVGRAGQNMGAAAGGCVGEGLESGVIGGPGGGAEGALVDQWQAGIWHEDLLIRADGDADLAEHAGPRAGSMLAVRADRETGDAGDADGGAVGAGDDGFPGDGRVGGGELGEVASLAGGDRAELGQVAGFAGLADQGGPGHSQVEQAALSWAQAPEGSWAWRQGRWNRWPGSGLRIGASLLVIILPARPAALVGLIAR